MTSNLAVLILHYGKNIDTDECLDSLLRAQKKSSFSTYILSVQSPDSDRIKRHLVKPIFEETDKNGGFAWAYNRLMKKAFADGSNEVIILNNDTKVDENFVRPLQSALSDERIGFVSPKIYFYPGNEFHKEMYQPNERGKVIWYMGGVIDWANITGSHYGVNEVDHGQFSNSKETDFISGCCLAATKQTIENVGLMDEKYFLYYEDTDWCVRAKRKGYKLTVEPKSVIWHKNAGSTGGSGSYMQVYYQTRNRFYFGMKYAPLRTKIHLVKNFVRDLKSDDPIIRQSTRDLMFGRRRSL